MSKVEQRKKGFTIGYLAGLCGMPLGIAPMFDVSNMCIYNNIALPNYSTVTDLYHRLAIMKHKSEDIYIIYDTMMGGFGVDSSDEVYFTTDTITTTSVSICPLGGRSWESVATLNYVEEREVNKNIRYYIGYFEDLVWTEEDIYYPNGTQIKKPGTEPVTIYNSDNIALVLGCRLGRVIRARLDINKQPIPDGVLISSDDYILRDFNGIYLIANEESDREKMLSSDRYILLDRNKRYLLPKESL